PDRQGLAWGDHRVGPGTEFSILLRRKTGGLVLPAELIVAGPGRPADPLVLFGPAGQAEDLPGCHDGQQPQRQKAPAAPLGQPRRQQPPGRPYKEQRPDQGEDSVASHEGLIQGTLVAGQRNEQEGQGVGEQGPEGQAALRRLPPAPDGGQAGGEQGDPGHVSVTHVTPKNRKVIMAPKKVEEGSENGAKK